MSKQSVPPVRGGSDRDSSDALLQKITDIAQKAFQISFIVTMMLLAYLLYGLFSGSLAALSGKPFAVQKQALETIQTVSLYYNLSLLVTVVSGAIVFYEDAYFAVALLLIAAAFAYGLEYAALLLGMDKALASKVGASKATLQQLHNTALILVVPGVLLILRSIFVRIVGGREKDLTAMQYGSDAKEEDTQPQAMIGAIAKCWQLPFCRESIRKTCPIFLAKTKCWKQRVGCMCEENIIRLAMGDNGRKDAPATAAAAKGQGFVAIGDLIAKSEADMQGTIATRVGPRGVKIPTNPHLTGAQKRERCNNCIIYNEHQRQKYRFLAPVITIVVPVLVYLQFSALQGVLRNLLNLVDQVAARATFSEHSNAVLAKNISGQVPIEVILIVCFTLIAMSWALRLLEYAMFEIKV